MRCCGMMARLLVESLNKVHLHLRLLFLDKTVILICMMLLLLCDAKKKETGKDIYKEFSHHHVLGTPIPLKTLHLPNRCTRPVQG